MAKTKVDASVETCVVKLLEAVKHDGEAFLKDAELTLEKAAAEALIAIGAARLLKDVAAKTAPTTDH